MKSPFPWFGGKSSVAAEVWRRFGDVPNYIEPFFGSGAVLLARSRPGHTETVNDLDGFVSNFWRAVKHDPEAVAAWVDYPVIERDLEARHFWLLTEGRARIESLRGDPEGFDAQVAGWWCWGLCCWIGSGWCSGKGPWVWDGAAWTKADGAGVERSRPHLATGGMGVNRQVPYLGGGDGGTGRGVFRKLPHLGGGHGGGPKGALSNGVRGVIRKRPELCHDGAGVHRINGGATELIFALSERLSRVRVCSGDWARICGKSVTTAHGMTGVFLDPPYSGDERQERLYATDCGEVAKKCAVWARKSGDNPLLRIAFCGYAGEHEFPGWTTYAWKARGGYGSQADERGRANCERETIWFSPACVNDRLPLFDS